MSVDFLTAHQRERYGRYQGEPSSEHLSQFFYLSDGDRRAINDRHGEANRLGFAVNLGTVRFLGGFYDDIGETPRGVITYLGSQLNIRDPLGSLEQYRNGRSCRRHQLMIAELYGYRDYHDPRVRLRLTRMLYMKAWLIDPERSKALFDEATSWLVAQKVLLPGITTLANLVVKVKDRARKRLLKRISSKVDGLTRQKLLSLLERQEDSRFTPLERLRRSPSRLTTEEQIRALDKVQELRAIIELGPLFKKIDLSAFPQVRLRALYRSANSDPVQSLSKIKDRDLERCVATLTAWAHFATVRAADDALELFDQLIARLVTRATRTGKKERLRSLKELDRAARILSEVCAVVLDNDVKDVSLRTTVFERVPKPDLVKALYAVGEITRPPEDEYLEHLKGSYGQIRRFLPKFLSTFQFESTEAGKIFLEALEYLRSVEGTKKQYLSDAPKDIISKPWLPFVITPNGTVSRRYYTLCFVQRLRNALRRRDVFLVDSDRWNDPRAHLLSVDEWAAQKHQIAAALGKKLDGRKEIEELSSKLDSAYLMTAARLPENKAFSIVKGGASGRETFSLARLNEDPDPETLTELRSLLHPMLPKVDLPQLLLEIDAKTGFSSHFTPLGDASERAQGLDISVCAVLMAEACNIGLEPLVRPDIPALTRARLEWVQHHYLRAETITKANAELVDAQTRISLARHWGGGEVASADGLRFTVPVQTINAAPNSKYFGTGRGITYYNYTSDQCTGFHGIVVPGTLRDSLFTLDGLLEHETILRPQELMTDTAGYSDVVFGLFHLLGFRFSPRIADMGEARLWRFDYSSNYGDLEQLSRNVINTKIIEDNWDDMMRIAGSLRLGTVRASEFMRTLSKGKGTPPSTLAKAIGELGKIEKTLYLLSIIDDEDYRRRILRQLNRGEARHSLARAVCHGQRGEIRKRYREGQEDQLGALGLVVNAIVLWNSLYMQVALEQLEQVMNVESADKARLLPFIYDHINLLGRYSFSIEEQLGTGCMRPLNLSVARLEELVAS